MSYAMDYGEFTNVVFKSSGYNDLTLPVFYNSDTVHASMVPVSTPTPTPTPNQTATPTPTPTPTTTPSGFIVSNVISYFLSDGYTLEVHWIQTMSGVVSITVDEPYRIRSNHYVMGAHVETFTGIPYGTHSICVNGECSNKTNTDTGYIAVTNVTGYFLSDLSTFKLFWSQSISGVIDVTVDGVIKHSNHYVMGDKNIQLYNIPGASSHTVCVMLECITTIDNTHDESTPVPTPTPIITPQPTGGNGGTIGSGNNDYAINGFFDNIVLIIWMIFSVFLIGGVLMASGSMDMSLLIGIVMFVIGGFMFTSYIMGAMVVVCVMILAARASR